MHFADHGAPTVRPADVERWLTDLGLEPIERAERDGIASWDLVLDGRRRLDLRVTIILEPSLALICWAHFAPPINDMFRKSYRRLLRWNDEFPFAKFSVGEDERPLLAVEIPIIALGSGAAGEPAPGSAPGGPEPAAAAVRVATRAAAVDRAAADMLGTALARIVGIADRLFDESKDWLWIGGRMPDTSGRTRRNPAFVARFAATLPELFEAAETPE